MIRLIRFVIVVAILTALAVAVAERPGTAAIDWLGYRLETPIWILLFGLALLALIAGIIARLWYVIGTLPGRMREARVTRRRRRGYVALTQGLVAVAAGDVGEAERNAKKAEGLLDDPPLTMLLSAQAAQLGGDERAAEVFFTAMLGRAETEFLGVRGLLIQAMKRKDRDGAMRLVRRAYRLRPKSEWVAENLLSLQAQAGQWVDAEVTFRDSTSGHTPEGARRHAALLVMRGREAEAAGELRQAGRLFAKAQRLDPGFARAAIDRAHVLIANGRKQKAARVVEATWRIAPHPDLVDVYVDAVPTEGKLNRLRIIERLAALHSDHADSHLAVARMAIAAEFWREAEARLETAARLEPSERVFRMWAAFEEARGDTARAQDLHARADAARSGPAWTCRGCGDIQAEWAAVCGHCESVASLVWEAPTGLPRLAPSAAGAATPLPVTLPHP
ncbi:MAG: heme biosynthesis protein HemY [Rhodospirillales bacterium]|nr:heme biosynthesis protein HemY [Rhodospirillales bacterium]